MHICVIDPSLKLSNNPICDICHDFPNTLLKEFEFGK